MLVFAVPTLPVVCGALAGVVVVGLGVARLPAAVLLRQTRAVRWVLVAIFVLHLVLTDALTGTLTVLRLLTLVLAAAVVTATTRVTEMVAVIERMCWPLRWVGVRPARIGLVIAMALRFIPVHRRARRPHPRGAGRARRIGARPAGPTTTVVPLLVQVLQHGAHRQRGAGRPRARTTSPCAAGGRRAA